MKKSRRKEALQKASKGSGARIRQLEAKLREEAKKHRRIEQDLRESREYLNHAQAVSRTGSWRINVEGNELIWSDQTYRMFGIPKGVPLAYETFLSAVHSDDRKYVEQKWAAALAGERYDIQHRILVKGEVRWVRERAELEFDKKGRLLGGFGTVQDITEQKKAEEEIEKLSRFPLENPFPVIRISNDNTILFANKASEPILKYWKTKPGGCLPKDFYGIVKGVINSGRAKEVELVIKGEVFLCSLVPIKTGNYVNLYARNITLRKRAELALEKFNMELEDKVKERTARLVDLNKQLGREILERKDRIRFTDARNLILDLMAKKPLRKGFLEELAHHLVKWTGCRNCGIRVLNQNGQIPYEVYVGFDKGFLRKENNLSVISDHCACIRAVNGRFTAQDKPCVTDFGSFCTNNSMDFIRRLSGQARANFRGGCIQNGYASIAVIPIKYKDKIIAAIHLAEEAKGKLPPKMVNFIESLTPLIGEGIEKFNLEERIRHSYVSQRLINTLLRLSLEEADIDGILKKAFDMLLSISWLQFEPRGGVFLVEEATGLLALRVHKGLNQYLQKECARLPFGRCVCGKAALKRQVQFIASDSAEHQTRFKGMRPHSHYCVPVISRAGMVLGVINIYLKPAYQRDYRKEEFLVSVANVLAEIIERKAIQTRLDKSSELLERIFSSTNFLIAYMDNNFNFIKVNKAYAKAENKDPDFFTGKNHFSLYQDKENEEIFRRVLETGIAYTAFAKPFVRVGYSEGGITYHDWSLQPVKGESGEIEGLMLALVDVTKRKLAEEGLAEAREDLNKAKRLSDIGTLAATVAHELRNPLAAIRMASYNIKRKAQNPELDKHLANIEKKITESDQIINNLLFYSRLRLPHYERINIHKVLEESAETARTRHPAQKTKLIKRYREFKNMFIDADPLQLKELFGNILNNSLDATQENKGSIEIYGEATLDGQIKVAIKDNGHGIEEENLQRIFEPFFTTKAKGTGLGLAVCRQIAQLHQGSIDIESRKDLGTTVSVRLPITRKQ